MKKQSPRIYVILLNWNGKKDTLECLASLQKIKSPKFWTLVVDNGSSDDSVTAIRKQFPTIPIYESRTNLGFAAGNNLGIQWALQKKADWICLLNNDTVVKPDFLETFLKTVTATPQAKILGAKIYRYDDPTRIDHFGGFWNPTLGEFTSPDQGKLDDGVSFEMSQKVDYVCGAALFMHHTVPEAIGLLESRFFLFWEETDFCIRAKKLGFEIWTAPQVKVWHKVSASFTGGKPHTHYFWWRSRLLWMERNLPFEERRALYRRLVFPELWKNFRHYLLISLRPSTPERKAKALRCKAGCFGALHYFLGRFGNCPKWLLKAVP